MKEPNNLSGIYFRYYNAESCHWENWCFEDLPKEKQEEYLKDTSVEWLKSMVLALANSRKTIGDEFEIKAD